MVEARGCNACTSLPRPCQNATVGDPVRHSDGPVTISQPSARLPVEPYLCRIRDHESESGAIRIRKRFFRQMAYRSTDQWRRGAGLQDGQVPMARLGTLSLG